MTELVRLAITVFGLTIIVIVLVCIAVIITIAN